MELLSNLVSVGPGGVTTFRRRMGVYFNILKEMPWQDEEPDAVGAYVSSTIADDQAFDLILDRRYCTFTTTCLPLGSQSLEAKQSDGVLNVSGSSISPPLYFTLSFSVAAIAKVISRVDSIKHRVKRLIVRMPTKDFRNFIYLDWASLVADLSRMDLAVRFDTCIFVPRLVTGSALSELESSGADLIPLLQTAATGPSTNCVVAFEPVQADSPAAPVAPPSDEARDFAALSIFDKPFTSPTIAVARRTLTILLPLADDLRTSFLAFGYSISARLASASVIEIGAFRRKFRSSYSRLMAGIEVFDLKTQSPAAEDVLDLKLTMQKVFEDTSSVTCLLGSEVLSTEVLEIFRSFAVEFDLTINSVVCSAALPSPKVMAMIENSLSKPLLRAQAVYFLAPGEPSEFNDARGYLGVPSLEGQCMANCMEFRSHAVLTCFTVPSALPAREAHALYRFFNAFAPLHDEKRHVLSDLGVDRSN